MASLCDLGRAFAVEDLFVAGLALEISGAFLFARGALSASAVAALARTGPSGVDARLTVSRAEELVDAQVGIASVVAGFVLQTVGVVWQLSAGTGSGEPGRPLR